MGDAERKNPPPTQGDMSRKSRQKTGPRTSVGKSRSSRNALTHGIFSAVALLSGEPAAGYRSLLRAVRDYFFIDHDLEDALAQELAAALWRLRRLLKSECAEVERARDFIHAETAEHLSVEVDEQRPLNQQPLESQHRRVLYEKNSAVVPATHVLARSVPYEAHLHATVWRILDQQAFHIADAQAMRIRPGIVESDREDLQARFDRGEALTEEEFDRL